MRRQRVFGNASGITLLKENIATVGKGSTTRISSAFNTGWMNSDIRRTYLSDNVVESVSAKPERVTNGDFDSATGWSLGDGTVSIAGGKLVFNSTPHAVATNGTGATSAPTVGMRLVAIINISSRTAGTVRAIYGGTIIGDYSAAGVYVRTFTAAGAANIPTIQAIGTTTAEVESFSIVEVEPDRSYKAQGASITGTLTKSAVASAAQLVAYSGFSNSNYLREPYSADLDFGTGEWTCSAWVNVPVTLPAASFPVVGSELVTNGTFDTDTNWTKSAGVTIAGGAASFSSVASGQGLSQTAPVAFDTSKAYLVTGTISNWSSGILSVRCGSAGAFYQLGSGNISFSVVVAAGANNSTLQLFASSSGATFVVDNISVKEVAPALITDRSHSSGSRISLGVTGTGQLTATAFDGTTTRTVTTTAAYNTATWLKVEADYTTDGTLSISVNGVEVATTRGNPLLTLNNSNAVLTIGNSYNLDAPFPGSIALLKLGATVPTAEQSVWMYEQEKQMFREGSQICLPDSGSIVDLTYDDATDKWIAISATNESEWSGLIRTSVTPVPSGSYSKASAGSGIQLLARTTTNPGVDITIPSYGLREELVNRSEAAARLNARLATFDYVGGFTANTTNASTAITNVSGLTYPTSYIGARISGSGIPANTFIVAVSSTTIYISAAATATASSVQISFVDFILPVGYQARIVQSSGQNRTEGTTKDYVRLFDGFKETIRFNTAPGHTAAIQIQAGSS